VNPLPLKFDRKYGYFPRWPEDGDAWVHPEDVAQARAVIPSNRVFRRDGNHGVFHRLYYGPVVIRTRPALWQEVAYEGFDIGDWVEVLSRGMRNEPHTGIIREMLWHDRLRGVCYQIVESDNLIPDLYTRDDIRHVEPVKP
jgi:hypothetical protein